MFLSFFKFLWSSCYPAEAASRSETLVTAGTYDVSGVDAQAAE